MRNLSIWFVDPFQIWPMKSVFSSIQGFDWVIVFRVVCIIQIFRICPLRVCNPYRYRYGLGALIDRSWLFRWQNRHRILSANQQPEFQNKPLKSIYLRGQSFLTFRIIQIVMISRFGNSYIEKIPTHLI